jgi:O-antigen/teichoic acid export membrane protein
MNMVQQVLIVLLLLSVSPAVFAYLDPSTGSMVISAIVGIIASVALALKTYWYRLKNLFRRKKTEPSSDDQSV